MDRILVTRRIFPEMLDRLAAHEVVANQEDFAAADFELVKKAADATAFLTTASDPMGTEVIEAAPKLRVISTSAVGFIASSSAVPIV
jgi:gluconate 2-dehydrogenase